MPQHQQAALPTTTDARIAALLHYLAGELPALLESGETWAVEINGTRDGKIYRMLKRSAPVEVPARRA